MVILCRAGDKVASTMWVSQWAVLTLICHQPMASLSLQTFKDRCTCTFSYMYLRCTITAKSKWINCSQCIEMSKIIKLRGPTPPGVYRRPAFDTQRPQCLTGSSRWRWCATGCRRWLRSSPSPLASTPPEHRFPQGYEDLCPPTSETELWDKAFKQCKYLFMYRQVCLPLASWFYYSEDLSGS